MNFINTSFFTPIFLTSHLLIIVLCSCTNDTATSSYYDEMITTANEDDYMQRINQSIDAIKQLEKKGTLLEEDDNLLKYKHSITELSSYNVTYLFDEKGCFEVGIDTDFEDVKETNLVINGFKNYFTNVPSLTKFEEDNFLIRWRNEDESLAIEMDISRASSGKIAITIFAKE